MLYQENKTFSILITSNLVNIWNFTFIDCEAINNIYEYIIS